MICVLTTRVQNHHKVQPATPLPGTSYTNLINLKSKTVTKPPQAVKAIR